MSTRVWVGGSAVITSAIVAAILAFSGGGTETMNCFPVPSACGFPDATNTGPTGTLTSSSGDLNITTPGTVFQNKNHTGGIRISANNVTIRNSRITGNGGEGSGVVYIAGADSYTGLLIEDSEIRGAGTTGDAEVDNAVITNEDSPYTVRRSHMYNCAHCLFSRSPLTVEDSYVVSNAQLHSGADYHFEGIYSCSSTVNVDHSTFFNPNRQTATVFADTICGGGNNYTITDSLLAGGGFVVYPQANASSSGGTTTITNNRIARCLDSTPVSTDDGHICSGINDAWPANLEDDGHGFYPNGGFFGVFGGTGFNSPGITWTGNVWDDNDEEVDGP